MPSVAENLARVKDEVAKAEQRSGRKQGSVTLVAVAKTKPVEMIKEAIVAGHYDFGENYAQELRDKQKEIEDPKVRWHFIGHLQKNKVKYVAGKAEVFHALDNIELAREMHKRAKNQGVRQKVMIEVNMGGEQSKMGVEPEKTLEILEAVNELDCLEAVGLMTMPPYHDDPEEERPYYRGLRELRDRIRDRLGDPAALPELSMGLSHDFSVAIEEGATLVRVGTSIFGMRDYD
jgi:pyridoxal phosphate enzyme (YggS family)